MLRKSIALAALALASALASKAGSAQARDTLLNRVHGRDADIEPRTIDVHINAGGEVDIIRTVRGTSYALDTDRH
jgi:two-component system phosphate regulon response regulator PhoB